MRRRKLIGVITALPESVHAKRVLNGIFTQCRKYDYDVAVFGTMINVARKRDNYMDGEFNIYELPNMELFDAVIIDVVSIIEDRITIVTDMLRNRIPADYKKPIVALNVPFEDYPVVSNSDKPIFKEITEHMLDVHNVSDIYFLTGPKGYNISEERADEFRRTMTERGFQVTEDMIIYGDFWYSSGAKLADDIASGKLRKPKAIICASDHMAIGLINRLEKHGIKVPGEILITGFEATQEALFNNITVTTFESNAVQSASDAVDLIRKQLEPDAEIKPCVMSKGTHISPAMSCGCDMNHVNIPQTFKDSFYNIFPDYEKEDFYENADIGQLMEEYIGETLAASKTPQECLENIYRLTYMNKPYNNFYLCLNDNWLDTNQIVEKSYTKKMKLVVHTTQQVDTGFYKDEDAIEFDTGIMLPQLWEENAEPSVFYFSPVHFMEKTYGYAVLNRSMKEHATINLVYRNWLRLVNTSLEMVQARNKLMMLSVRDEMTGAYNRRGMRLKIKELLSGAAPDDIFYAYVIDMDGLKYINDTFGHNDGDMSIRILSNAISAIMLPDEICVRAGGDEFYMFGVGKITDEQLVRRTEDFTETLKKSNETINRPYIVTASIGCASGRIDGLQINNVINTADERMYRNKIERKKQRI